jgi:hypothetical protein
LRQNSSVLLLGEEKMLSARAAMKRLRSKAFSAEIRFSFSVNGEIIKGLLSSSGFLYSGFNRF